MRDAELGDVTRPTMLIVPTRLGASNTLSLKSPVADSVPIDSGGLVEVVELTEIVLLLMLPSSAKGTLPSVFSVLMLPARIVDKVSSPRVELVRNPADGLPGFSVTIALLLTFPPTPSV